MSPSSIKSSHENENTKPLKHEVLVTGGSGFIGRHCISALLSRGFQVHAITRQGSSELQNHPHLQWHNIDLFDRHAITHLIQTLAPSTLLHCAWIATPGIFWESAENLAFLEASVHLFQAFGRAGGERIIGVGTCAEYDWSSGGICIEESTALKPHTIYGQCKQAAYLALCAAAKSYGFTYAWARLFFPYGKGEPEQKLISAAIHAILSGTPLPCTQGRQQRDFLHVKDVAQALVTLLESTVSGAFNIGSGKAQSLREVVGYVTQILGQEQLIQWGKKPEPLGEPPILAADMTLFHQKFHWAPKIDMVSGIKEMIRVNSGNL